MKHQHLTHDLLSVSVTEYQGCFLITVSDSHTAAIVLERVIKYKVHCWIGLNHQQSYGEPFIYAAHPVQMWQPTVHTMED